MRNFRGSGARKAQDATGDDASEIPNVVLPPSKESLVWTGDEGPSLVGFLAPGCSAVCRGDPVPDDRSPCPLLPSSEILIREIDAGGKYIFFDLPAELGGGGGGFRVLNTTTVTASSMDFGDFEGGVLECVCVCVECHGLVGGLISTASVRGV